MKSLITFILSLLLGSALAQTQIPNGGFEEWTPNSTNIYYEPGGDFWATLNPLATLGGPVTVSRTTDAYSGEYAAQLESKLWGDLLISGLLVSGNFIANPPSISNGQPFTDKPSKFIGWYKYTPINGDSAGVAAILTRYNAEAGQQDTIAKAINAITENVQTYTQFVFDFDYLLPGIDPDTIIIVFSSSGDAGNFQGQDGSTLLLDDISLEYPSGLLERLLPEFTVKAFPSPAAEWVSFQFDTEQPEQLICYVYTLDGRLIRSFSPKDKEYQMDVSTWQQSKYILQVFKENRLVSSAKFIVAH